MKKIAKHIVVVLGVLLGSFCAQAQNNSGKNIPVFLQKPTPWADSLIQTMTLDEQIGQLFMVAAWSDPKHQSYDANGMDLLIKKYGIGGVIFFQGSPVRQAILTNRFQSHSKVPLMIGMDAEWGLGMRLDSTISYPRQMTLGAIQDESLIYDFGVEMARQLKRLGVTVSFSPVVDVNNNPLNPVISNRAFGENRELVTKYSLQYMQGLQDGGVLANAKHFPGHGDTDSDSHKDLPVIPYNRERLDSVELYPYKTLFNKGLSSVMIAHLFVPALDSTPNVASTLSPKIVNGVLKQEMGFEGLVFTDALNMQGVSKYFAPGETDVKALIAGNDVLLYSLNVAKAIEKIKVAIDSGWIQTADVKSKCLKILRAKEWAGLDNFEPIATKNLVNDLNDASARGLQRRIIEKSITILKNDCNMAPLCQSDKNRVAVVSIGASADNAFTREIGRYANFDSFSMEKNPDFKSSIALHDTLVKYDLVVAAMMGTSNKASKNFGVSNESARIMNSIGEKTGVTLCVFANPYALNTLKDLGNIESIVVSYQDDALTEEITAQVIAGACTASGRLPVSANTEYLFGEGLSLESQTRLRWVAPSYIGICGENFQGSVGGDHSKPSTSQTPVKNGQPYKEDMMSDKGSRSIHAEERCFSKVDSIARWGIDKGAYPGCRVLVAKDGYVIYDKGFGYLDWDKKSLVNSNTVYDLASITKVASSTLCAMKLVDEKKLDVNKTLGDYLDIPDGNEYATIVIRDMLAHTAGLTPWIPFYQSTMNGGSLRADLYSRERKEGFTNQVADSIFIMNSYRDSMFAKVLVTPLSSDKSYKYSDLAFYFMQRIIEKQTGLTIDEYARLSFYKPMGLKSMGYKPLDRMDASIIAPTENDQLWRKQHLQGFVHDQGAAMLGGVGGHAGLFSNAQDLAAVMQMLLNGGSYSGKQLLSREVIEKFNTRYYAGNRRGLGFDKPSLTSGSGSTCADASAQSFGHTGFTGTMCWADPSNGLVYIFLSNRVDPDAENKKLQDLDIRTKIQHEIYKVVGTSSK